MREIDQQKLSNFSMTRFFCHFFVCTFVKMAIFLFMLFNFSNLVIYMNRVIKYSIFLNEVRYVSSFSDHSQSFISANTLADFQTCLYILSQNRFLLSNNVGWQYLLIFCLFCVISLRFVMARLSYIGFTILFYRWNLLEKFCKEVLCFE